VQCGLLNCSYCKNVNAISTQTFNNVS